MTSVANTRIVTGVSTLGLALAAYLTLLKLFALPCVGPGHCGAIVQSRFGSVYGIPIGVFGALLWSGAILTPDRSKRGALLVLLAVGSAGYMGIQFIVLRGFCIYCTMHALCAFAAVYLHAYAPRRWAFALGLVMAAGGFGLTRQMVTLQTEKPAAHSSAVIALDTTKALPWLGLISPKSPTLVISLNCPACLDLLDTLEQENYTQHEVGPALFFKTTDENRVLNVAFIAAVFSQAGSRRDAFLAVTALFLSHKDTALASPTAAAAQLSALFPDSASHVTAAEQAVDVQKSALAHATIADTTPLLITPDGKPHPFFKTDELFPH